jgi:signal peptidase
MANKRSSNPILKTIVWLALFAAMWLLFAPIQLGGRLMYVIVTGNSMEPRMHNGDLAVLTPSPEIRIGDVVLYQHPKLGPVIHRIIAQTGDRYVLQGDHNNWKDSYQPTASDIKGKQVLTVPLVGKTIRTFRTPNGAALIAGVIGLVILWPVIMVDDPKGKD